MPLALTAGPTACTPDAASIVRVPRPRLLKQMMGAVSNTRLYRLTLFSSFRSRQGITKQSTRGIAKQASTDAISQNYSNLLGPPFYHLEQNGS